MRSEDSPKGVTIADCVSFPTETRLEIEEQSNGDWSGQARLEMYTNVRPSLAIQAGALR